MFKQRVFLAFIAVGLIIMVNSAAFCAAEYYFVTLHLESASRSAAAGEAISISGEGAVPEGISWQDTAVEICQATEGIQNVQLKRENNTITFILPGKFQSQQIVSLVVDLENKLKEKNILISDWNYNSVIKVN